MARGGMPDNLTTFSNIFRRMLRGQLATPPTSPREIYPSPLDGLGITQPGNVNLYDQPRVMNPDGSRSTVDSWGVNIDGQELLLPSVTPDGRHLRTLDDVTAEYRRTGRHLGAFDSVDHSNSYASRLHNEYLRGVWDKPKK